MKKLNFISLFDGMSCGQISINKLLGRDYNWFASEINKGSINITQGNFPETTQLGDVRNVSFKEEVFMVMGGSPCQSFSIAGRKKGMTTITNEEVTNLDQYLKLKAEGFQFEGESYLFWEFVRIVRETKPKYFFLENVVMKGNTKKWEILISKELGVQPIRINSSLLTAQNRDRLYWTNIPNVIIPEDRGITLGDIIPNAVGGSGTRGIKIKGMEGWPQKRTTRKDLKSNCLTKSTSTRDVGFIDGSYRPLTIEECEVLQGVPIGYTDQIGVTKTDRYEALGNGWTVDVILHIFSFIPEFKNILVESK